MDAPENSVHPATRADWRAWLADRHGRAAGVWVITWKKAAQRDTPSYDDLVEEALCFGWVDSRPGKLDGLRTMLYFAPRKPGSGWARPNKLRIERLVAAGLMTPAGQAKIDAAKADGSWEKLDAVEALEVPADLAAALAALAEARANWDAFPRSARRGILEWVVQARRPETRARRVAETARLAAVNERANQWKGRTPPP
ncbi:MAG: YdeI/OmpD-associated family protein [Gemmataceae bacterium]